MSKRKRVAIPAAVREASPAEQADVAVTAAVAPYRETLPVELVTLVGKLGDQPPLRALSALVIGAGIVTGNKRLARAGFRMLAAHTVATVTKDFVKRRVDRTRPALLVEEGRYAMEPGTHRSKEQTSFPSGHTAGAVAVARAFARDYPEHAVAANAAAAVVSLAQIPRCAHYPTDVGAGAAIGLASEALVARLI